VRIGYLTDTGYTLTVDKPPRAELASQVLNMITHGYPVTSHDALQLRNWAIRPDDAMLSLEEIAYRILAHDGNRNTKAHQCVASSPLLFARPALAARRAFCFCPRFLPPAKSSKHWPRRQAPAARAKVGQAWRNGGQSSALQQPKLSVPVRLRPAQPFEIGMPRADLRFDGRDLLAAAGYSHCHLLAFSDDLVERAPVAIEDSLLARILLIPPANDIGVARIQFH
jgi:hypothetical protein